MRMKMKAISSVDMPFASFKVLFQKHLNKIRESETGDKYTMFFRSTSGEAANLHEIPILSGTGQSEGGYFITKFHADNGKIYPIYCKVFSPSSVRANIEDIYGLITESCIGAKSVNKTPLIPTLVRNYGVLAGNHPESVDFYNPGKTKFIKHTYGNVVIKTPIYIFNEYFNVVDTLRMMDMKDSAISLCKFVKLVKDVRIISRLVYRTLLTIKEMHRRGLYHNDLHCGNIMVVKSPVIEEYDIRIFDWDFGFSGECMPPKIGRKEYCGDGGDCYSKRDYWDVLRFITSLSITKEQLFAMFPGDDKIIREIGFIIENKTLSYDDILTRISQLGPGIESVQTLIDMFNPMFISPSDNLFGAGDESMISGIIESPEKKDIVEDESDINTLITRLKTALGKEVERMENTYQGRDTNTLKRLEKMSREIEEMKRMLRSSV
jgi:serine/threonine protein kinase